MGKIIKRLNIYHLIVVSILTILTLVASYPLLRSGFYTSHDGLVHLINLAEFDRMIRAGQFPVRWAADLDFGYGNPIFSFYSPSFYYLSEILVPFMGYLGAIKSVLIFSILGSGIFTYLLVKDWWGIWGGSSRQQLIFFSLIVFWTFMSEPLFRNF